MGYANGMIPLNLLVHLGADHYLPPGTAARWKWLQRLAFEKYGVWLVITPGFNAYRPLSVQVKLKKELGKWAAAPGFSTHGGVVNGRTVFAIDVNNWAALGWARFSALCRLAGFTVNFVTPEELWHIGDYNDGWTVPAGADSTPTINHETTRKRKKDSMVNAAWRDENGTIAVQYRPNGKITMIPDPYDWNGLSAGSGAGYAQISNAKMQELLARYGTVPYPLADTGRDALPVLVYVRDGNGTVYLFMAGKLTALVDPSTLQALHDQGAATVTLSQAEVDNLLKG
jgi:hypothetical protein